MHAKGGPMGNNTNFKEPNSVFDATILFMFWLCYCRVKDVPITNILRSGAGGASRAAPKCVYFRKSL